MQLMTKEIERKLPKLYSTDGKAATSPVIVKFFTPDSSWTWYVIEGEQHEDGDWEFFGLVDGHEKALVYFMLSDMKSVRGGIGLPIERDMHFGEHLLGEFMP